MSVKIIIKLLLLILVVSLSSCFSKEKQVLNLDEFSINNVDLSLMELDSPPLFPKGCVCIDSTLIIYDAKEKEGFLSFYRGNRKVGCFGNRGEGPNDFRIPRFFPNKKYSNSILVGDTDKLYIIDIDSAMANVPLSSFPFEAIPENLRLYNYLLCVTDSMLVVNQTGEFQLAFYDKIKDNVERKNYFEKISSLYSAPNLCYTMQIYDAYYTSNNESLVIAYKHRKQIDIISKSGDLVKQIYFPNYDMNNSKMSFNGNLIIEEDSKRFFTYVYPDEDSFYALCWNDTKENIKYGKAKPLIYKFDWEGNLNQIYQLNQCISYFCVSDNQLYAIGIREDDLELCLYEGKLM